MKKKEEKEKIHVLGDYGDYDAVGELTFRAKEYNGQLIDIEGIPVLSPEILIDNLLNHARPISRELLVILENVWKVEKEIFIQKNY